MQNKQNETNFQKIIEKDNALLEAAVSSLSLQLRLIVAKRPNFRSTYIGEINNLNEHEELQGICDTFDEVLDLMRDPNNVRLSLEDKSVTLVAQFGSKKTVNIVKVMLSKKENEESQFNYLEHLIERCNSKEIFEGEQIKINFGILVNEIMIMKEELYDRTKMENIRKILREEMGHMMNELIEKKLTVVENRFIKVEEMIIKDNDQQKHQSHERSKEQSVDLEARVLKSESYYENQIKRIDGEVKRLGEMFHEKLKETINFGKCGKIIFQQLGSVYHKDENQSEVIKMFSNTNPEKVSSQNSGNLFSSSNQNERANPFFGNQGCNIFNSNAFSNSNQNLFSKGPSYSNIFISSNKTKKQNEKQNEITNIFNSNCDQSSNSFQKLQNVLQKSQILQEKMNQKSNQNKQNEKLEFYKQQKCAGVLQFDGKTLKKIWQSTSHPNDQFVFFDYVPFDKEYTFKVKIVKSFSKQIMIGVVDYDKQKQHHQSNNSNNALCYDAFNGLKYPGNIKEGNGVNVGETVEVRVDRRKKIIRWMVNNEQIASYVHNMLGEQQRKLMPFVEMCEPGDTIEYIL